MAQDPVTRPEEELEEERPQSAATPLENPPPKQASGLSTLLTPELAQPPHAPARAPKLPSAASAPPPTPHGEFLARKHFASLDGLRALGILAVIWHHTAGERERFGANLFFLLSGFLVTTLLLRERKRKGTIDVLGFRVRRARRLFPLYFTVLLGYVGLVAMLEPAGHARDEFFAHLPSFATFTSNLFVGLDSEHVIFYFAWSLAAQEQFYLVWPALLKRTRRATAAGALAALLALAYLTRASLLDALLPEASFARTLVLSIMPALGLGALLALALDARAGFDALRRVLGARWTSCVLLATALVIWRLPSVPEPVMHLALVLLTGACVLREDHALARFLRHPWAVHVGVVSYGIYLMHMLCHNVVERGLARLGASFAPLDFALTALLAVGVATLSHRHFESRFLPAEKRARRA